MKRIKIITIVIAFVMLSTLFMLGCGTNETQKAGDSAPQDSAVSSEEKQTEKSLKVAYIVADLQHPAWVAFEAGWQNTSKELGIESKGFNSNGDANTQMKITQDLITMGYDAVGIFAPDSSAANSAVKELNKANIPVWIMHVAPDDSSAKYEGMVDAQNENGTYEAGKYLASKYKEMGLDGSAADITISLARSNGKLRHSGFVKAMDEAGIEVSATKECQVYTRDEAYKFTQDLLTANDDISIVYCNHDEAALGALKAVQDADRTDEVLIGGFDGSPESLQAVSDGEISVVAVQPMYTHGVIVVKQMNDYFTKNKAGEKISTECPLVTVDNATTEKIKVEESAFGPK